MRKGGGQAKGSEFERKICGILSKWASDGERTDLFSRNIMSGGRFTLQVKLNDTERSMPGDIRANHPLAYMFLDRFLVECKHYASLSLDGWLFDNTGRSLLGGFIKKASREAEVSHRHMMLIAKQNNKDTFLLLEPYLGEILVSLPLRVQIPYFNIIGVGTPHPVYMFNLEAFLTAYWLKRIADYIPMR